MADIRAILKINDTGNGELETFTTSIESNNLSLKPKSTEFKDVVENFTIENKNFGGAIGTPIGITKIQDLRFGVEDANNIKQNEYKGLDFGYTDNSGVFNFTITIVGSDIISFSIVFDALRNQYPTDYTWIDVDGVVHNVVGNTSNEITFEQNAGYGTTTITFSQWALPNTMVGITYIENIEIDLFLDKQWIMNFESLVQNTSNASEINYMPIANTGQITLKDIDDTLLHRAEKGHLNTNVFELELYVNNVLQAKHISTDTPMYTADKTMQFQLTDEINQFANILVPEKTYSSGTALSTIVSDILDYYELGFYNNKLKNKDYDIAPNQSIRMKDMFARTTIQSSMTLKEDTLLNQISKICNTFMLSFTLNANGYAYFDQMRPKLTESEKNITEESIVIDIPFNKQYSALSYDILVKNAYDEVERK